MTTQGPPSVKAIVDSATSEAKRRAHAQVTLAHCAVVIGRGGSDVFGAELAQAAERYLGALPQSFDAPVQSAALTDLLNRSATESDPARPFIEGVATFLAELQERRPEAAPKDSRPPKDSGPNSQRAGSLTLEELVGRVEAANLVEPREGLVARTEITQRIVSMLGAATPQQPLVVGDPGSGRSTVADLLVAQINSVEHQGPLHSKPVIRISAATLLASEGGPQATAFNDLFHQSRDRAILYFDDFDVFFEAPYSRYFSALRSFFGEPGFWLMFVVSSGRLGYLQATFPEFAAHLDVLRIPVLKDSVVAHILEHHAADESRTASVDVPQAIVCAAMAPARQIDTHVQPGVGVRRIDRAIAAAASRADKQASIADLGVAGGGQQYVGFDAAGARERLSQQVIGQDDAVELVTRRLAVTRAGLDLRPERPDGVFLFAGPTGTGKTALALALAEEVFGSKDALIRIDMSELSADHTTSTLVGSPPGYLGSTEPDSWLVTKIRNRPQCVLLLDEIEKAHPIVWNTFLQVFDAGRLSDTLGNIADFRDVVIVMTTNIGASEFAEGSSTGFAASEVSFDTQQQKAREQIKLTMRPELLNRLDATLIFSPLSEGAVRSIAAKRLDEALERAAARGWIVEYDESVIDYLVERGYSREYGARPLMRVIEHDVLNPIVGLDVGKWRLSAADGVVEFE